MSGILEEWYSSASTSSFCRERYSFETGGYMRENYYSPIKLVHFRAAYWHFISVEKIRIDHILFVNICHKIFQTIRKSRWIIWGAWVLWEWKKNWLPLPFSLSIHTLENSARTLLMWSFLLCIENWRFISFGPYTTILDSFSCAASYPDCSTNAYIFNQAQQFVVLSLFYYTMPYIIAWKKAPFPGYLFLGEAEGAATGFT